MSPEINRGDLAPPVRTLSDEGMGLLGAILATETSQCSIASSAACREVSRALESPTLLTSQELIVITDDNNYSNQKLVCFSAGFWHEHYRPGEVAKCEDLVLEISGFGRVSFFFGQTYQDQPAQPAEISRQQVLSKLFQNRSPVDGEPNNQVAKNTGKLKLYALLDGSIAVPIASFEGERRDNCDYVLLGNGNLEESIHGTAQDDVTPRLRIIEFIRDLMPSRELEQLQAGKLRLTDFAQNSAHQQDKKNRCNEVVPDFRRLVSEVLAKIGLALIDCRSEQMNNLLKNRISESPFSRQIFVTRGETGAVPDLVPVKSVMIAKDLVLPDGRAVDLVACWGIDHDSSGVQLKFVARGNVGIDLPDIVTINDQAFERTHATNEYLESIKFLSTWAAIIDNFGYGGSKRIPVDLDYRNTVNANHFEHSRIYQALVHHYTDKGLISQTVLDYFDISVSDPGDVGENFEEVAQFIESLILNPQHMANTKPTDILSNGLGPETYFILEKQIGDSQLFIHILGYLMHYSRSVEMLTAGIREKIDTNLGSVPRDPANRSRYLEAENFIKTVNSHLVGNHFSARIVIPQMQIDNTTDNVPVNLAVTLSNDGIYEFKFKASIGSQEDRAMDHYVEKTFVLDATAPLTQEILDNPYFAILVGLMDQLKTG